MKVVALSTGFYGGSRRRAGDTFEAADGDKAKWFAPVDVAPKAPAKAGKQQPVALSQMGKENPKTMTEVLAAPGEGAASGTADSLV